MKNRLPVVLSATALVVAVLGVTPVGQATSNYVQTLDAAVASVRYRPSIDAWRAARLRLAQRTQDAARPEES